MATLSQQAGKHKMPINIFAEYIPKWENSGRY